MAEGLRYREYLEARMAAVRASWIINGSGAVRHSVRPGDLVGVWMDGRVVSKREAYEIVKARVKNGVVYHNLRRWSRWMHSC
jgi:hypothetical protein